MFTWLSHEIKSIKTRRFHLTNLPSPYEPEKNIDKGLLPPSYLNFIREFGYSKLYRNGSDYIIQIFDKPYIELELDGSVYVRFGTSAYFTKACFRLDQLTAGNESSVFELEFWEGEYEVVQAYINFDDWLVTLSNEIKDNMTEDEWIQTQNGPPPFSQNEQEIVEGRKKFAYTLLGFKQSGDAKILIKNNSNISLPYLSVGVEWIGTKLPVHTIWLPIHGLKPGDNRIITHDIYKNFFPQEAVKLVDLPDPDPEDKDIYWEFKYK